MHFRLIPIRKFLAHAAWINFTGIRPSLSHIILLARKGLSLLRLCPCTLPAVPLENRRNGIFDSGPYMLSNHQ